MSLVYHCLPSVHFCPWHLTNSKHLLKEHNCDTDRAWDVTVTISVWVFIWTTFSLKEFRICRRVSSRLPVQSCVHPKFISMWVNKHVSVTLFGNNILAGEITSSWGWRYLIQCLVLLQEGNPNTQRYRGRTSLTVAETRVMHLQAKEHQGLVVPTRS